MTKLSVFYRQSFLSFSPRPSPMTVTAAPKPVSGTQSGSRNVPSPLSLNVYYQETLAPSPNGLRGRIHCPWLEHVYLQCEPITYKCPHDRKPLRMAKCCDQPGSLKRSSVAPSGQLSGKYVSGLFYRLLPNGFYNSFIHGLSK